MMLGVCTRYFTVLLVAGTLLATGCRHAQEKTTEATLLKDALAADSHYGLDNVPQGLPPQRAASFRLAARGYQALCAGRLQVAEDQLEQALSMDARNPFCYLYLAEIRYLRGDYRQAVLFLQQSVVLFDGHPYWLSEAYAREGQILDELRETDEAFQAYHKSLEYNPWNETALQALGRSGPGEG